MQVLAGLQAIGICSLLELRRVVQPGGKIVVMQSHAWRLVLLKEEIRLIYMLGG